MGIQIETTIYGAQIGRELAGEPEELRYALEELTGYDAARLGREVAEVGFFQDRDETATWLRNFADALSSEGSDNG